jgi:hypothetical protein
MLMSQVENLVGLEQPSRNYEVKLRPATDTGKRFSIGIILLFCLSICLLLASSAGAQTTSSPATLSFGNQALGVSSAPKISIFKNTQTVPLTINSIAISGTNAPDFALAGTCLTISVPLKAGNTCTISVTFTPSALLARSASVVITDSASTSPQTIALTGTGVAPVTLSPTTLSFGTVVVGNTTSAKAIVLTNHQNAKLSFTSIVATGDFAIAGNNCGASIAGGATCTVNVTFSPKAIGGRAGTLTFTDSALGSTQTVAFSGTGSVPVTIAPASLTFPSRNVNTTSSSLPVTLTNHLSSGLSVSAVATGDFAVGTTTCGSNVGASCAIGVTFTPTRIGTRSGTLTITYSALGSPSVVNLFGTGIVTGLTSIVVTPAHATPIPAGATQQFVATGTLTNGTQEDLSSLVTWSTSAGTISSTGLLTSSAQGTYTIKASLGSTSGTATLNVSKAALVSIALAPTNPSVAIGNTLQFAATGTYTDGTISAVPTALFSSSSPAMATITTGGLATGVAIGTTSITATSAGITSPPVSLNVIGASLQKIVVTATSGSSTPATPSIANGTSVQLFATGIYSDNSTQDITSQATWSSNSANATVTNTQGNRGLVTGATQGTSNITASLGPISGTATVNITAPLLKSIAITPASPAWSLGQTQQFTATGTFTDGSTQDLTTTVTWSSDSTSVATIVASGTGAGLATSVAQGTVNISAAFSGITASTQLLTVGPAALNFITVNPSNPLVALGTTQAFTANGTYSDGTSADLTTSVTWSATPNPSGAATFAANTATATAQGFVTITATSAGISGTTQMTISAAALTSIAIAPGTATIHQGATQQFVATGRFSDNTTQDVTASVAWSTTNGAIATISTSGPNAGLATSVGPGTATISASLNLIVSTNTGGDAVLSVVAITSIAVSPPGVSLNELGTQQFTAVATYSDGSTQDITNTATWSSANPAIVTIGSAGVSGTTPGLATVVASPNPAVAIAVTASSGNVAPDGPTNTGFVSTIFIPVVLQSIAVSPRGVSLNYLGTQQFTAIGTFSDGSTQDITSTATWSSANPQIVAIGTAGLAGTTPGLATVVANPNPAVAIAVTASSGSIPPDLSANTGFVSTIFNPNICAPVTLDMRLLVVNNSSLTYADFPAIQQILNYIGVPYTVVDAAGGTLPTLSDGACHGYFQGVIYAFGDDIYTFPFPVASTLAAYEAKFGVRQLNWNTNPTPDFGLNLYSSFVASDGTDTGTFTATGKSVFFYANTSTPVTITNAFIYLTTPTTPSGGGTVLPLLIDPSGNTLSAITNFNDGRQYLSQTFDSNQFLTHDLVLAYGLVNWVTKGVFLGDYHVYAAAQVDDFFIDDSEWIPGTPCTNPITHDRTPPDSSTLPVFRIDSTHDMAALTSWQDNLRQDPLLTQFELTMAFNGVGTTGNIDWTGLPTGGVNNDDLVNNVQTYQGHYHWISHTFDHPNTLNGLTQSVPNGNGDDIDQEVLTNQFVANGSGRNLDADTSDSVTTIFLTDFNPANMITPGVTGLNDPNVPSYLYNDGIRNVVTDTSVLNQQNNGPNPSPNVGIANNTQPGLYEVPRHPNDIYFNAANWADNQAEFSCIYNNPVDPPFNTYNAAQILDFVSSSFVSNMLIGDMDPEMFHQPDLHFTDNSAALGLSSPHVSSLLSDTYDQTFQKYKALYNLPVLSPTLDQTALLMQNRNSFNRSGVTASISGVGTSNPQITITMPSGAQVPSAIIPVTGLTSAGSEMYGGQNISHFTMTPGTTITLPLQ